MKRLIVISFLWIFLQGCDDGDVIITTFDFDNIDLKTCGDVGNYVFYKENTQVFESLSLRLGTTDSIYNTEGTKIYDLSSNTTFVNYRSYDGVLGNNYFCNSIPPIVPTVEVDYLAVSGRVEITVSFVYENPATKFSTGKTKLNGEKLIEGNFHTNQQNRATIKKSVKVVLKDIVLVNGDKQITQETLNMGTIENVRVVEINP